jgi:hypothetical protein
LAGNSLKKYKIMKFLNLIAALMLCTLLITSCSKDFRCADGSGSMTTKELSVSTFTGIDFALAGDVNITQGNTQKVSVTGNSNIVRKIETRVSGGVWDIDFGKDCFNDYELSVNITTPNIEEIYLSGSGDITLNNFSDQEDLTLRISGSGSMDIGAFSGCEELSVNISGNGSIKGNSDFTELKKLSIGISGSGSYEGFPIRTDDCNIDLSGSGNCEVFVRENLDVKISGSGTVYYEGNPSVSLNISGSGKVVDAN